VSLSLRLVPGTSRARAVNLELKRLDLSLFPMVSSGLTQSLDCG
jgi:hypothetical protein